MDSRSVFEGLLNMFPQIDARILKAVAIENSKDVNEAVEVVLNEIVPNIPSTSDSSNYAFDYASYEEDFSHFFSKNSYPTAGIKIHDNGNDGGQSWKPDVSPVKSSTVPEQRHGKYVTSTIWDIEDVSSNLECLDESNVDQLCSNVNSLDLNGFSEEVSPVFDCPSQVPEDGLRQVNDELEREAEIPNAAPANPVTITKVEDKSNHGIIDCENEQGEDKLNHGIVDCENGQVEDKLNHGIIDCENEQGEDKLNHGIVDCENGQVEEKLNHGIIDCENDQVEDNSKHGIVDFEDEGTEDVFTTCRGEFEDKHVSNTRSSQICRIDVLEDIINDARDNKKNLFSSMESVISLMREVEAREKEADEARAEAARGPIAILSSVEDLKQMLKHAREAKDMHTGEVYGEKAILATEAKELQSRLLCLSDERDKSLGILDEMRQTLEQRLDAAEKAMKSAEHERMEKEESARNALAEQQQIMEKLVQESKMLKQEAEDNSKLQEFLMDRGRVVDTLQGEISVIFQDIILLKQKFDNRVPLSDSISSSQTSCRLASSNSSARSLTLDEVPKRTSPAPSFTDHLSSGEEREASDHGSLVEDDGWEVCDKDLNM